MATKAKVTGEYYRLVEDATRKNSKVIEKFEKYNQEMFLQAYSWIAQNKKGITIERVTTWKLHESDIDYHSDGLFIGVELELFSVKEGEYYNGETITGQYHLDIMPESAKLELGRYHADGWVIPEYVKPFPQ